MTESNTATLSPSEASQPKKGGAFVRRLEIHGFKTFASQTVFEFPEGITAIVGPNGSGKSNIADAIRWLLGEQRMSVLRAKKSEDLIFNGTDRRARMGMAQAFLTIDNSSGILPIDFSEVVIGRRTYRSGENEYLINGRKVRLRDIQELLAHAGIGVTTYTVIGQGLVDAALSLRADERRQMIEDAAGLGAYQGKRNDALRKLAETEENLQRARDIVAELAPRVRRLQRQAEKAEEYIRLNEQLRDLLRKWYGYQWGQATQAVQQARAAVQETSAALEAVREKITAQEAHLHTLRAEAVRLRNELEQLRRDRAAERRRVEALRRDQAVAEERARLLARQAETLREELAALEAERETLAARGDDLRAERERLEAERAQAQAAFQAAQARLRDAEQERERLRREVEAARKRLARLSARLVEIEQQQAQIREQRERLNRELEEHQAAMSDLRKRLARHEGEIQLHEDELETLRRQAGELQVALLKMKRLIEETTAERDAHRQALNQAERELSKLEARRDLLARLREEGTGYAEGVRALLQAARRGQVFGILGPVADFLRVPPKLAVAVSAALGDRLQGLVVRDLEAAIVIREWLANHNTTRVTILPLANLKGPRYRAIPQDAGVLGRAADLVQAEDPGLLEHLLGAWLIVRDWNTAARLANRDFWNIVTIDGDVLHADGSLQAGQGDTGGRSLLEQSREWAELPERLEAARRVVEEVQARLEEIEELLAEHEAERERLLREMADVSRAMERVGQAIEREKREIERVQQEQNWRSELIRRLKKEYEALRVQAEELETESQRVSAEQVQAELALQTAEQALEAAHPGALREAVEKARTVVAVLDEQLSGLRRQWREWEQALERLERQRAQKEAQLAALSEERAKLAERQQQLAQQITAIEAAMEGYLARIRPIEERLAAIETEQVQAEEHLDALRKQGQAADEVAHRARLSLQAAEDRLAHLGTQIENDLGLVEYEDLSGDVPQQTLLPLDELVTTLPKVTVLPEGLENDIRRLRRLIGQLGAINPEAPQEYAELKERYEFLTTQADDLEKAAADLRHIVAELDRLMTERFRETFDAINAAFKRYFKRLFGGGTVDLELTNPEDPLSSGVEIIARPPGKRPQSIALLSGGERALTAAALIFAILSVSPAPFCVLDEVDAMLDEANVGRFRETLLELAEETQFIVITHNRGTIEAADTIYGVSQTEPGVSTVISLALDEAIRAAKH